MSLKLTAFRLRRKQAEAAALRKTRIARPHGISPLQGALVGLTKF